MEKKYKLRQEYLEQLEDLFTNSGFRKFIGEHNYEYFVELGIPTSRLQEVPQRVELLDIDLDDLENWYENGNSAISVTKEGIKAVLKEYLNQKK